MNKSSEMPKIIEVRELSNKPKVIKWSAEAQELKALAKRLNVLSVDDLTAEVKLQKGDLIQVNGHFDAHITQSCVVTGQPIKEAVSDSFEEFFCLHSRHDAPIDLDMESPDIEAIEDGRIDVGELVIEYLILGLNPFPRKSDVPLVVAGDEEKRENPFAVLEKLKKN